MRDMLKALVYLSACCWTPPRIPVRSQHAVAVIPSPGANHKEGGGERAGRPRDVVDGEQLSVFWAPHPRAPSVAVS